MYNTKKNILLNPLMKYQLMALETKCTKQNKRIIIQWNILVFTPHININTDLGERTIGSVTI